MPKRTERTTTKALQQLQAAAEKCAIAETLGTLNDPTGAYWERRHAAALEQQAQAALTLPEPVRLGVGAEAIMTRYPDEDLHTSLYFQHTLDHPSGVAVQASYDRMQLALAVDALPQVLDLAETFQARNSVEKLLAGQMATAHQVAMKLLAKSLTIGQLDRGEVQGDTIEACRLTNAAARLMSAFNDGVQTLVKLRTGGKQTVVVQHVYVNEGGQAVVTGDMATRGSRGGGIHEMGGTTPCTEPSRPPGPPRAVGHTPGKGQRAKRPPSTANAAAGCTAAGAPAPREAISTP